MRNAKTRLTLPIPGEPDPPMKPLATVRMLIVLATVLVTAASPVRSAQRGGMALDETPHAHAPAAAARTPAAPAPHAQPAGDDAPGSPSCTKPNASGAAHHELGATTPGSTLPAKAERHAEKRGRTTPANGSQMHRPQAHRGKSAARGTPATPGMGMLLRIGTNAGREISYRFDVTDAPNLALRSGRAPPRAGPHSHLAPAPQPRGYNFAVSPRTQRSTRLASAAPSRSDAPSHPCACRAFARAPGLSAAVVALPSFQPEPFYGSHAARSRGEAARFVMPLGGRNT